MLFVDNGRRETTRFTISPRAFGSCRVRHAPWHMKKGSSLQRLHPSKRSTLLSSHSSPLSRKPLPHNRSTAENREQARATECQRRRLALGIAIICVWCAGLFVLHLRLDFGCYAHQVRCDVHIYTTRVLKKGNKQQSTRSVPDLVITTIPLHTEFGTHWAARDGQCRVIFRRRGKM